MSIPCAHQSYVQDCPICAPREAGREAALAGQQALADAIRAAVQAEREACAALCDQLARDHGSLGAVATLCPLHIRSRGNVRLP